MSKINLDLRYLSIIIVLLDYTYLVSITTLTPTVIEKINFSRLFPLNAQESKYDIVKLSKGAKIRNRYNQVPHLTQVK